MADRQLVLAIFANEADADAAVEDLKAWQRFNDVALRPIGVLVLDDKGKIKEHKLGQTSGGKGATIGLVLAALTPPTLLAGLVVGGIVGHLRHQSLGLNDEDRDRIAAELSGGKAAVGILVESEEEVAMFSTQLTDRGGTTETHTVSDEALAAVAAAAPETPAAGA